jgi:hypothetical protein
MMKRARAEAGVITASPSLIRRHPRGLLGQVRPRRVAQRAVDAAARQ